MNQSNNQPDPYDSLASALRHIFIERKQLALMAFVPGFILGGSLLLLLTAYLIAWLHGNAYTGIVAFTSEAILLLQWFWLLGGRAYADFKPKTAISFLALFMGAFVFSLAMPGFVLIGLTQTLLIDVLGTTRTRTKPRQDLRFTSLFNRLAHIN